MTRHRIIPSHARTRADSGTFSGDRDPSSDGSLADVGTRIQYPIEHGTRSGYYRCVKRPEGSCLSCRKANADYQNDYRESIQEHDKLPAFAVANARRRARVRLSMIFPEQYQELLLEELVRQHQMRSRIPGSTTGTVVLGTSDGEEDA